VKPVDKKVSFALTSIELFDFSAYSTQVLMLLSATPADMCLAFQGHSKTPLDSNHAVLSARTKTPTVPITVTPKYWPRACLSSEINKQLFSLAREWLGFTRIYNKPQAATNNRFFSVRFSV